MDSVKDRKIRWIFGVSVFMSFLFFLIDVYKSYDAAIWLLYILPMLFTSYMAPRRTAVLLLFIVSGLIITGSMLSKTGDASGVALLNRVMAICVIGLTTIILLERRKTEDELRKSEERYRDLVELSPEMIFIHQGGKFVFVNDAGVRLLGAASSRDIVGKPVENFIHTNHIQAPGSQMPRPGEEKRNVPFYLESLTRCDGTTLEVETASVPIDYIGRPAVQVFARDVTDRKRLEEHLRQSQKIEAVGRLAGGIAHDFNNLMTVITGYVGLTKKRIGDPVLVSKGLEEIGRAGERATRLTQQLIAFGRKQVLQPQVLDLNAIVFSMDRMLRRIIGEHIELFTFPGHDIGKIKADPGQVEQVIVNLVLNARDAMPKGGILTIETGNASLDESQREENSEMGPGAYVKLEIRDNGVGMDPETKSHIFEPYFSTKEVGKGSGLGLATVYGIIRQSGGHITVESSMGKGTTFTILFPQIHDVERTEEMPETPERLAEGKETILLVEDEPPVRALVREALQEAGYTVLEASGGEDAIDLSSRVRGPIHLMLTDVVMPGMNGTELAKRMASLRPEMKVLFMSGYAESAIAHRSMFADEKIFLGKPFTPEELAQRIRDIIDN